MKCCVEKCVAFEKIANANFFPHADVIKFLLKVSEIYPPRLPPIS